MKNKKFIKEIGWNLENSYASLPEKFFTNINPTPVISPKLIILNKKFSRSLGFNPNDLENNNIDIFAGNRIPESSIPIAQAYAGHQFGYFNMLGDGRAILLGEQITPSGEKFDIQLKGSGITSYSRGGDGRAGLGPMLREYIISEAMNGLNIPTTRSLAVVTTGEAIFRETLQKGAILTRIASSHIRVGTFQYVARFCTKDDLKALADYTLKRHFKDYSSNENPYLFMLKEVIKRQAKLIAKWQLVGFIHGVMNTDNMTISGETIDYGPCAFMDVYDLETVFSSIDTHGRYSYGNQPDIAGWNLARFAECLIPLLHDNKDVAVKLAQDEISNFNKLYKYYWISGMRSKLGIFNEEEKDEDLIKELLNLMYRYSADYTNTFVSLTFNKLDSMKIFTVPEFKNWNKLWEDRLKRQNESREMSHNLMKKNNPAIIPRNHRVEEALEAAVKNENYTIMEKLIDALSNPYEHSDKQAIYATPDNSARPYVTYCGT